MSFDWPILPLEECLDALIDYRGKTPEKTSSGIPLITAKVIKNGRIEKPSEFIAIDDYDVWMRRGIPKVGDVVMTTEAPLGEVAQLSGEKIALAQRVITLRGKSGLLDSSYLLYLLQTAEMQEQLKSRATGTTVLGIKQSELRKVTLKIPPLALQKDAASILSVLDKKIDLLRETNTTLEAIAQTLFKSWFVDFDPVKAKAEGRLPEDMDEATAALFPSEFEESALGLVPKGWRVDRLDDQIDILNGFAFKSEDYKDDGIFVLRTKNFDEGKVLRFGDDVFLPLHFLQTHSKYLCQDFDYHLVMVGASVGKRGMIFPHQLPALRNQNMWCFRAKIPAMGQSFVKFLLDSIVAKSLGLASGSAREFFRKGDFGSQKLVFPEDKILADFNKISSVIFSQQDVILAKIDTLTTLRDTLLPRLISGQLRLNQAQDLLDEVMA